MNSSYKNDVCFGDLIATTTFIKKPKNVVEIGILEGYSLQKLIENAPDANIMAYDIFDKFNGNHADKDELTKKFNGCDNVTINYGDFYEIYNHLNDNSIDILHIDVANNGKIYDFVFEHYIQKMSQNGIIMLEGGSIERDNIEWMIKYDKPKIAPIISKYSKLYNIKTFGIMPSITIVTL